MKKFTNIAILILLAAFITFRVNVACNELSKDEKPVTKGTESPVLTIPASFSGQLSCTTCPRVEIELHIGEDMYSEKRTFRSRESQPYNTSGTWTLQQDTLTTFTSRGSENLLFLVRNDTLYWLLNGEKVEALHHDNWNYLTRQSNVSTAP